MLMIEIKVELEIPNGTIVIECLYCWSKFVVGPGDTF